MLIQLSGTYSNDGYFLIRILISLLIWEDEKQKKVVAFKSLNHFVQAYFNSRTATKWCS